MGPVSLLTEEPRQVLFNSKGPCSKSFDEVVSLRATAKNELKVRMEEVSLLTKREGLCQFFYKKMPHGPLDLNKTCLASHDTGSTAS